MATPHQIGGSTLRPKHGIVHEYSGNLYVRLYDNTADQIQMWKSTDSGVTWAQVSTSISLVLGNTFIPGCGTVSGSVMYITYAEYDFAPTPDTSFVSVLRFDMATDSWLSTWTGPALASAAPLPAFTQLNQCGVRSDGSLVIVYIHTEPVGISFQSKWRYVTCSSAGVFGAPADLSSAWQTWLGVAGDPQQLGPVVIATDDAAHFFYNESITGSSSADVQLLHRRLTLGGTLSGSSVAMDIPPGIGTQIVFPRNAVHVSISGSDSTAVCVSAQNAAITVSQRAAMISGLATGAPGTTTINTGQAQFGYQQWITVIGTTVYGTWSTPNDFSTSSKLYGVRLGSFVNGTWQAAEEIVSAGNGGLAPYWFAWTVNPLGSTALGFVFENWDDETPWFMRYVVGSSPAGRVRNFMF